MFFRCLVECWYSLGILYCVCWEVVSSVEEGYGIVGGIIIGGDGDDKFYNWVVERNNDVEIMFILVIGVLRDVESLKCFLNVWWGCY